MNQNKLRLKQLGLTLMELVVVLVILIALAGIVVALLPNLLTKTHDATVTTNIAEVNKAIAGYRTVNFAYPNLFDSIVDSTGSIYSKAIFNGATFTNSSTGTSSAVFTLTPLTAGQASSLNPSSTVQNPNIGIGIQNLMVMKAAPTNATFDAYVGLPNVSGSTVPVTSGTNVLIANDNYVYQKLNMPQKVDASGNPIAVYVVLGLGQYCTMVGSSNFGIFEAPISFGEHAQENPTNSYARMLCVFRAYNDGTPCEYLGCAHPDVTGLGTADMHFQEFYSN